MGKNLAKAPLLAVLYASMLTFVALFVPVTVQYAEYTWDFVMGWSGYLVLIGYCLFMSLVAAVLFWSADRGGVKLMGFALLSMLGLGMLVPALNDLLLGEITGVMTKFDTLMQLLVGFVGLLVMLVLGLLLYDTDPVQSAPKYKLQKLGLLIRLVTLPFLYMVLYFLAWYFLGWRNVDVRAYWGSVQDFSFIEAMIEMLLTQARLVPLALLRGLLYAALSLPLCLRLLNKRTLYIALSVALALSASITLFIPNPVLPGEVRLPLLLQNLVVLIPYMGLTTFLLHGAFKKQEEAPAPEPERVVRQGPARPAPVRR